MEPEAQRAASGASDNQLFWKMCSKEGRKCKTDGRLCNGPAAICQHTNHLLQPAAGGYVRKTLPKISMIPKKIGRIQKVSVIWFVPTSENLLENDSLRFSTKSRPCARFWLAVNSHSRCQTVFTGVYVRIFIEFCCSGALLSSRSESRGVGAFSALSGVH